MIWKYKPSDLRGHFGRSRYFEGWFQKVYSREYGVSFILIYGYATRNTEERFGFIQIVSPDSEALMLCFPEAELSCDRARHIMWMGSNTLSTDRIEVHSEDILIRMNLTGNHPVQSYKNSMGYTYFVPGLPCYHSVVNTSHLVSGVVQHRGKEYALDDEMGYLEKNWGSSFPDRYFWLHALDPGDSEVGILFSQAEIRWLGRRFVRHVGHVRFDGKLIDFRDLANVRIEIFSPAPDMLMIRMNSKTLKVEIAISQGKRVLFKGPRNGQLSRDIPHHTDAIMHLTLSMRGIIRCFDLVGNYENMDPSRP